MDIQISHIAKIHREIYREKYVNTNNWTKHTFKGEFINED